MTEPVMKSLTAVYELSFYSS